MIRITRKVFEEIIEVAYSELPDEACGYLAGGDGFITHCFKLKNMDQSPEHYSFNPEEQFEVLKAARLKGLKILANFHSHPLTPARPSMEDIQLAYDQDILYGIVSLKDHADDLKFYRIQQPKYERIDYIII